MEFYSSLSEYKLMITPVDIITLHSVLLDQFCFNQRISGSATLVHNTAINYAIKLTQHFLETY